MIQAVRRKERVFQVGSMQRSMREFRVACELVRNGVLGKIDHVDVTIGGPAVPCDLPEEAAEPELNWDFWLGPAPQRPYNSVLSPRGVHNHYPNWRHYREYGGGAVTDFGGHHFDIAQWGLGNYNLFCRTGHQAARDKFLRASDCLIDHLEQNRHGVWVWNHHFDWEYRETLRAPWYSVGEEENGRVDALSRKRRRER